MRITTMSVASPPRVKGTGNTYDTTQIALGCGIYICIACIYASTCTSLISVDESDIAAFKKLHEMGIELEIRPVAKDKKVDLMSKIEGIEG